jgi:hypothetical protein
MNTVGGTAPGARNLISGNLGAGVFVRGQSNVVQGNFIGTDVTGTLAIGNATLSVFTGGVVVSGFSSLPGSGTQNLIGGTTAAARNVISGNNGAGIVMGDFSGAADRNIVRGNYIGVDVTGTAALGNLQAGVNLDGATNSTIGGTAPSAANVIRNNGGDGVVVFGFGTSGQNNGILGNSISENGQLGIDLTPCCAGGDGVTPNDPGDADTGGNALQNFPILTAATSEGEGGGVAISGTLNSRPSTTYRVELYSNGACDVSLHGEGEQFLGALNVTTNAAGNAAFTVTLAPSVPAGRAATATATDPLGNTSEFSACRIVQGGAGQGGEGDGDNGDGQGGQSGGQGANGNN